MKNIYQNLLNTLEDHSQAAIVTTLSDKIQKDVYIPYSLESDASTSQNLFENAVTKACADGRPFLFMDDNSTIFTEPFYRQDRLLVFGGGHVAYILSEIAAKIGFSVIVTEDRPEFGNKERFPWAAKVNCEQFDTVIDSMTITDTDYIVLLTRGHFYDKMCLKALYKQKKCAYLGILASRRRMGELTSQLAQDGIEKEWMEQIHSPVGLNIGAVTPEEIAIAILAQIIQTKRLTSDGARRAILTDIDMRVIKHLSNESDEYSSMKKAIVTVIENSGITPRKAGAKMVVYEDGHLIGTIGGGPAEGNLIMETQKFLHDNELYHILYADIGGLLTEDKSQISNDYLRVLIERA